MTTNRYSQEFREQILLKAMNRGTQSLPEFALEQGLILSTLKGWLAQSRKSTKPHLSTPLGSSCLPLGLPPIKWDAAQRLLALEQSHGLSEQELGAWCRTHGLFAHHLKAWREHFCTVPVGAKADSDPTKAALRGLQGKYQEMERELRRKEKALAETAALLVLQKKFQALLQDPEK
ncbi:MAG: transposase [Limnobacter sp.]|nr:transposase [Limnobacter sp.]